jgi:hypothetical protein
MSGQATDKDFARLFGTKHYQLGTYLGSDGEERYGFIPGNPTHLSADMMITTYAPAQNKAHNTGTFKKFLDVAFLLFILGLLGVIVAYFKDGSNSGFNRFFNSNSFGPRFFMVTNSAP